MNQQISISALTAKFGMTRQNFYKIRKERHRAEVDANFVGQLVKGERKQQPRLGGRKLFKILSPVLEKAGVKVGRDRFFKILREKGLLVPPLPKSPRTTRFESSLPVFHNLVAGLELTGPNQAWAADITYISETLTTLLIYQILEFLSSIFLQFFQHFFKKY